MTRSALAIPPRGLPAHVPVELGPDWSWWPASALLEQRVESPSPQLLAWLEADRRERWALWRNVARDRLDPKGNVLSEADVSAAAREIALSGDCKGLSVGVGP